VNDPLTLEVLRSFELKVLDEMGQTCLTLFLDEASCLNHQAKVDPAGRPRAGQDEIAHAVGQRSSSNGGIERRGDWGKWSLRAGEAGKEDGRHDRWNEHHLSSITRRPWPSPQRSVSAPDPDSGYDAVMHSIVRGDRLG
jgi:hypothetical protein